MWRIDLDKNKNKHNLCSDKKYFQKEKKGLAARRIELF